VISLCFPNENETEGSDIQREPQVLLDGIEENDFHGAFGAWKKQWDGCVHSQGDYFEGDGSQNESIKPAFIFDLIRDYLQLLMCKISFIQIVWVDLLSLM
jgi:hypothetical protein